ncbi:uncharacterized protein CCOS01_02307 [Colletotrichum costaricense]|uniref:Uncharacterized protein n=1 Tax=Colletotrichum costaricense TaxID=1209916 RepID=A0AAI9Z985_9PEZI|nr:uncharacterized protein CCOS01_02307 [Colletotrichum costaricense]KAK1536987.1 hypothetical protein CCOS01_02307 [Colletotrichum costaricense]
MTSLVGARKAVHAGGSPFAVAFPWSPPSGANTRVGFVAEIAGSRSVVEAVVQWFAPHQRHPWPRPGSIWCLALSHGFSARSWRQWQAGTLARVVNRSPSVAFPGAAAVGSAFLKRRERRDARPRISAIARRRPAFRI